jgi:hypothetical protein
VSLKEIKEAGAMEVVPSTMVLNTVLVNNNAVLAIKYSVGKQHNAVLAIHFHHHEASALCHL